MLEVQGEGPVVTVALNRPEVRNAFNAEMITALTAVFAELASRPDLRAVVLRGNGPSFSAGADVNWMRASLDYTPEENFSDALRLSDMLYAIESLPAPLVARVHGAALGGGMGLLAVCDIVVAARDTVFGFTETKLGIIPAAISRFVLPKIGAAWARALFLTGERFDADLAVRIGLVHWVVEPDQLDQTVRQKVEELLGGGPRAVREAKALVAGLGSRDPTTWRTYTAERIAELRASPEGQEGLRAFLEKRRPAWRENG
jgi:methylglutaconyl-CoA hydratase